MELISGYENEGYRISEAGVIVNRFGRTLKHKIDKWGYHRINLRKSGKNKDHGVHRLVMQTYVGHSPLEVDHINNDKDDNRVPNLEYVTSSINKQRRLSMGVGSILTEEKVREMRALRADEGLSYSRLGSLFGVSKTCAHGVIAMKSWWWVD